MHRVQPSKETAAAIGDNYTISLAVCCGSCEWSGVKHLELAISFPYVGQKNILKIVFQF